MPADDHIEYSEAERAKACSEEENPGLVEEESSRQRLIRLVSDICALVR